MFGNVGVLAMLADVRGVQKNNPPFQRKDGLQKPEYVQGQYRLTLRELRALTSFLQAVLLTLNHTWVTRKQARLFQLGAIFPS